VKARVVLDASAFDVLGTPEDANLRALLRRAARSGEDAYCAAVTLAEVCRGTRRTRRVEVALAQRHGGRRIRVIPTDKAFAKRVGGVLHDTNSGSEHLGDAHVVAACVDGCADTAVVVTSDAEDIRMLAQGVKGVRILIRNPTTC
jgi:predicted nucleic acid-binding protein